ncbi:MAG: hypothetical protein Q7S36_03105 [Candidatus Liptonbacteria bacterium]|nr:hypothetical protein [Candidatus Liptonbacteria bacterium]
MTSKKKVPLSVAKVSVAKIRAEAAKTIAFKGWPNSYTEYSCEFHTRRDALAKDGATKDRLELYDRLVEGAPIRGGRFNPYAGD